MPLFDWTPAYSVRVRQFDDEHRRLFDIVNELNDAMRVGQGRFVLRAVLDNLLDYTRKHFGAEEEAMRRTRYTEAALHTEEHRKLTEQVEKLIAQYEKGETSITIDVLYFLRDWLQNHIMDTDQKYAAHLNANGVV